MPMFASLIIFADMEKVDIVIPYVHYPFPLLRYVLRGIKEHGKNYGKIFIVGDKPNYLKKHRDIVFLDVKKVDCGDNKAFDVWNKVYKACLNGVSDRFILFASDYFLTEETDFLTLPTYIRDYPLDVGIDKDGKLTKCRKDESNGYRRLRALSARWLSSKGYHIGNYDLHCPMPMERDKVLELSNKFPWRKKNIVFEFPYVIKSSYGNYFKIKGEVIRDNKIMFEKDFSAEHPKVSQGFFFSIGHFIHPETSKEFNKIYPKKHGAEIVKEKKDD